jgi:hypothetical protein
MEGYCVKCKAKRNMLKVKEMTSSGRRFAKGECKKCGTGMSKILGSK